jgi:hypothetical protein
MPFIRSSFPTRMAQAPARRRTPTGQRSIRLGDTLFGHTKLVECPAARAVSTIGTAADVATFATFRDRV